MRIESSVTSISWIPSESMPNPVRLPLDVGIAHYDAPPPDQVDDLEDLRSADRFRFANELKAWIEVEGGAITGYGHAGGGHIGSTRIRLGPTVLNVPAVSLPVLRLEPIIAEDSVRFVQTAGGRTGVAMPRPVKYRPFVQIASPIAWTTLGLTIHVDGRAVHEVVGASPFPRHWIYDHTGQLVQKTGLIDFGTWFFEESQERTPWAGMDSAVLVTEAETAIERELSRHLMRDSKPVIRSVKAGTLLCEQGDEDTTIFLLLDGVLEADVDGKTVAELGPGAIVGERASLEGGRRTATLRAATPCRVAAVEPDSLAPDALRTIAAGHRRES